MLSGFRSAGFLSTKRLVFPVLIVCLLGCELVCGDPRRWKLVAFISVQSPVRIGGGEFRNPPE